MVPWIIVAAYSLSSLFMGTMGFSAYSHLENEHKRLSENMDQLQSLNKELLANMDSLLYDADTITVYARELGYGKSDERFVRVVGVPGIKKHQMSAGQLLAVNKNTAVPDMTLKIVSFALGFMVLICFIVTDVLKRRQD